MGCTNLCNKNIQKINEDKDKEKESEKRIKLIDINEDNEEENKTNKLFDDNENETINNKRINDNNEKTKANNKRIDNINENTKKNNKRIIDNKEKTNDNNINKKIINDINENKNENKKRFTQNSENEKPDNKRISYNNKDNKIINDNNEKEKQNNKRINNNEKEKDNNKRIKSIDINNSPDKKNSSLENEDKSDLNEENDKKGDNSPKRKNSSLKNEEEKDINEESEEEIYEFDDSEEDKNRDDEKTLKIIFGKNKENYRKFLEIYEGIFRLTNYLKTTFYTLSFETVKDVVESIDPDEITPIISYKFFSFILSIEKKVDKYDYIEPEDIYKAITELVLVNTDFQTEVITSALSFYMLNDEFNDNNINCSLMKLYQDIGFCIKILYYTLNAFILHDRFAYQYNKDLRVLYYINLFENCSYRNEFDPELLKIATESARIKDTIIIGNEQFRKKIIDLNLPSDRINELDDSKLYSFFQNPYFEEDEYKIVKYFVICEDEDFDKKYFDEIKNLSCLYGFAYIFIVYLKNKKLQDIKNILKQQRSIIYVCGDNELFEIYKDNNEKLRPRLREYIPENFTFYKKLMNKNKKFLNKEIKEMKSTSEEGWDLFELKNERFHFGMRLESERYNDFIRHLLGTFIEAYKAHDSLEIFFKHYSNYFFLTLQPEFIVNMTALVKMFLYAYTLDEGDPDKNLYCIVNNDLRSSDASKINGYIEFIEIIGGLVKYKRLKSFDGYLYRATYLKDDLIKKIKPGLIIVNSPFWSSTKKESVAKDFLKENYKNTLIIVKGGINNNIDIHIEKVSRFPEEEEVLFLPFCNFKIKSFDKVKEDNLSFYKLELEGVSDGSLIGTCYIDKIIKFNFEKKYKI